MMLRRHPADASLADLARGASDPSTADAAARTAAHVATCDRCRGLVAGFAALDAELRRAPRELAPPADLWPSLRARLDAAAAASTVEAPAPVPLVRQHDWSRRWTRRAAVAAGAAGVCLVAAGALVALRRTPHDAPRPTASTERASAPRAVASPVPVDADADAVEAQLLSDLRLQRGRLRPETAAQVDANLRILDSAITEIQGALVREPGSQLLRDLLAASRERKADLLRQTENAS